MGFRESSELADDFDFVFLDFVSLVYERNLLIIKDIRVLFRVDMCD